MLNFNLYKNNIEIIIIIVIKKKVYLINILKIIYKKLYR